MKLNKDIPMRTAIRALLALSLGLGLAGCDSDGGRQAPVQLPVLPITYQVGLSTLQVVNNPAAPETVSATADIFSVQDNVTTLNGSVTVAGAEPDGVTVNSGFPGENGPVFVSLTPAGGDLWEVPEGIVLSDEEFNRLNGSGYYLSVQTADGELRGQIVLPGLIPATVSLDVEQTVPSAASTGRATAGFLLDPDSGFIRLRLSTAGVNNIVSAGLSGAASGVRGDVIVPMEVSRDDASVWGTPDINDPNASAFLTQEGAGFIITGTSYFSVETATSPRGELRGQLVPNGIDIVDVTLQSDQVVRDGPPVESSARGTASVTWNFPSNQLSIGVNTDLGDAISVGIYRAAADEIGPLLLSLMPDVTVPGNWSVQREQITNEQADALIDDLLYVSVVTEAYPEGELRGQILLDPPEPRAD